MFFKILIHENKKKIEFDLKFIHEQLLNNFMLVII
jgi:hypothetical protein